jgi:hypothetical protein
VSWFRSSEASQGKPFFEVPSSADPTTRRLLLVTYTFPPDLEVGGLRWQQMVRHFAERGFVFDVLTQDFRRAPKLDPDRLQTLPPGTRVFSVPSGDPLALRIQRRTLPMLRRLRGRVPETGATGSPAVTATPRSPGAFARAYLAWVTVGRDGNWALAAARAGRSLVAREKYLAVISSGPPHMAHEGARRLARRSGLPHVVDMRDPWRLVQRLAEEIESPVWRHLARKFERRVVRDAALITMNTDASRDAMRAAYSERAGIIETIRNGCDDEPLPPARRDGRFTIRFAGSIYIDRDPRLVFRAAAWLVRELDLDPDQLAIEFVGDVDRFAGTPTMQIAVEEGVEKYVTLRGLVKRQEALEFLAGATVLLSLPQDSDVAIPAKIYEYLRFDAWMLILAHASSATARLLAGTDADVLEPADVDGMARVLRRRYEQFIRGEIPLAAGRDGRFDRRVQSERLMDLIEGITGPR